jgi:hypothetical protein
MYDAWKIQGVRDKLSDPQTKRHEFKSTHSFRSYFETKCQKTRMNHTFIKILMDRSFGESENCHKPTEGELFDGDDGYLKAVDLLTINEEFRLRKKIEALEVQKSRFETIIKDVEQLKRKYNRLNV